MKKAVYAGSFAPLHLGHIYLIEQAAAIFDEVHVLLATNLEKQKLFSADFCMLMLQTAIQALPCANQIKIVQVEGMVTDYMYENDIHFAVRGVRDSADFYYERNMAYANAKFNNNCTTIFIPTRQDIAHISSSLVRECLIYNKSVADFVPTAILPLLQK